MSLISYYEPSRLETITTLAPTELSADVFERVFDAQPRRVEAARDSYTRYTLDEVLAGVLRDTWLRPCRLQLELDELPDIGSEEERKLVQRAHEKPHYDLDRPRLVFSRTQGVWIVGWGDKFGTDDRAMSCAVLEVGAWHTLLGQLLVTECGWDPITVPITPAMVLTHHEPEDMEEISIPRAHVLGKRSLPRLGVHLVALEGPFALRDEDMEAASCALLEDLTQLGRIVERDASLPPRLPEWMVGDDAQRWN